MNAVVVDEGGAMEMRRLAPPEPGLEEVLIAVRVAAVSFADMLLATGRYQFKLQPPFIPGSKCAGVVEAVGRRVTAWRPGDRVAAMGARPGASGEFRILGTYAEKIVADSGALVAIPDGVEDEVAAAARGNYETATYALRRCGLAAGETLLVLGAGGGVGYAAAAIGKALGARVIASASSPARRRLAREGGADFAIDSGAGDWRQQIEALTGGRGVDCVFDPVGGDATERAFRALAYRGRHLVIGFAAGSIPCLPTNLALMKGASLVGVNFLRAGFEDAPLATDSRDEAWRLLREGRVVPPRIGRRYPLAAAAAALAAVSNSQVCGNIVLTIDEAAPHPA